MTSKTCMLKNICKYFDVDFVLIRDGSSIPIFAIGKACISKKNKIILPFNDVLLVVDLAKNLLYMCCIMTQYLVNYEFSNVDFFTRQIVLIGKHMGNLYVLPTTSELYFSHWFKFEVAKIWHQRLGHP